MPEQQKKCCLYLRISNDPEGLALGTDRQLEDCQKKAAQLGWTVVKIFPDNDLSASRYSKKARPGYDAMLAGLAAGEFSGIIAASATRLTRRMSELTTLIDAVNDAHADIATVEVGVYDLQSGAGRMIARQFGSMAEFESDLVSERVKRKNLQRAQAGQAHGRSFGINDDGVSLNESEASIIREVAANIIAGQSVRSQCQNLNAQGILTERGNKWLPTSLVRLLKSARIAGQRDHLGVLTTAQWPPIITQVQRAQLLARFSAAATPGRPSVHLLSGILKCGQCGTGLVRAGIAYVCPAPPRGCQKISISALATERYVIDQMLAHADTTPLNFKDTSAGADIAEEIARDRATVLELAAGIANGSLSIVLAQSAAATIESRIAENMIALAASQDVPALASVDPETGRAFYLRDIWEEDYTSADGTVHVGDTDADERRWIIRERISSITVLPSTVRRTFTFNPARLKIEWRR